METRSQSNHGPLAGILVLDFGQAAVGPVSASYMAMLGATVIKIESPGGDLVRAVHPYMHGVGTTYIGNNVGKFGTVIDLKSDAGRENARRLIARADVVIDNFRSPEVMIKLGLDYFTVMRKINPEIVYVQSSAFGVEGPWSGMFSYELIAQACSGFAAVTGADGGLPELSRGTSYLDWSGAMINLVTMLAALWHRRRTGEGMMLETSQLGSSVFAGMDRLFAAGADNSPRGSVGPGYTPDRIFSSSDGEVSISAPSDAVWRRLCGALDRPDLLHDPELRTMTGRMAERDRVEREIARTVASLPVEGVLAALRAARVPCAEHRWGQTISERLLSDPQVEANRMLVTQPSRFGPVLTQSPHWQFRDHRTDLYRPSPALGEHTDLVASLIGRGEMTPGAEPADSAGDAAEWKPQVRNIREDNLLAGVKVLEIGSGHAVSVAGMVFARLGANVTKLEAPEGDWLRGWGGAEHCQSFWNLTVQGKRVVTCDLDSEVGQEEVRRYIAEAEIVVVDGPTVERERWGVTSEAVREINPATVYCGITGWGSEGPLSDQPASELDIEIAAGMTLQLGRTGGSPIRHGFQIVSVNTGMAAVQASLAALLARSEEPDGVGDHVEVSMLHTAVALNQCNVTAESETDDHVGFQVEGYNWRPDHGFKTTDGRVYIALGPGGSNWTRVLDAFDRNDLLQDERFATAEAARENEQELLPLLDPEFGARSTAEVEEIIRQRLGGAIVPIFSPAEVIVHPQVVALGLIHTDERDGPRIELPIRRVLSRGETA